MKMISVARKKSDSFTLYPLSDVHWPAHDHDKLEAWRDAVLSDETALVTLGGDLFDFARGKYRGFIAVDTPETTTRGGPVDDMAYAHIDGLAEFLKPIAGKVAAYGGGQPLLDVR